MKAPGFELVPDVVPEAAGWRAVTLAAELARIRYRDPRGEIPDGVGGDLFYDLGDGFWCDAHLPGMLDVARRVEGVARARGLDVELSPFPRSRYVAKVYRAPHGRQGWHFDTNGLTALVYLTDNPADGATRVVGTDGAEYAVHPRAGALLLMAGRECWHRADPVFGPPKALLAINLYAPGDTRRPSDLDDTIYGPLRDP